MPSHYPNQCWDIVNWIIRKLHWNLNRNSNIFIQEKAFECVVCEMVAMLSRPQQVNTFRWILLLYAWCITYCGSLLTKVIYCVTCCPQQRISGGFPWLLFPAHLIGSARTCCIETPTMQFRSPAWLQLCMIYPLINCHDYILTWAHFSPFWNDWWENFARLDRILSSVVLEFCPINGTFTYIATYVDHGLVSMGRPLSYRAPKSGSEK